MNPPPKTQYNAITGSWFALMHLRIGWGSGGLGWAQLDLALSCGLDEGLLYRSLILLGPGTTWACSHGKM